MRLYGDKINNYKMRNYAILALAILAIIASLIFLTDFSHTFFHKAYINESRLDRLMISFFVEYPEEELDKIELLDFDTKLYVAAPSIREFNKIKLKVNNLNVTDIVYWPTLKNNDGYWLSPFSDRDALLKVIDETNGKALLWDAELPRKKYQAITRLLEFFKNKKDIENYFHKNPGKIYTAEYFPHSKLLEIFGLSFNPNKFGNKMIKMIYSSMHEYPESVVQKEMAYGKNNYGDNFIVGLGTLAAGVKGDEPKISPELLERDLRIAREAGVKEAVIYRLGGLSQEYLKVIKKHNKQSLNIS